jgi:hypothetical protein
MPHSEAQAWWADVQHVRESIERRRAGAADPSAPLDASDERRFARRATDSLPVLDDLEWSSSLSERSGRRFEHASDHAGASRTSRRGERGANRHSDGRPFDRDDDPFDFDAERAALETSRPAADRRAAERPSRDSAGAAAPGPTEYTPEPEQTPAAGAVALAPSRRTVQITGRTVAAPSLPRLVEVERRRPARRPAERVGPRPDRVALWAVLLGFFLILVAATSSHAATQPAHASAPVALHAPAR